MQDTLVSGAFVLLLAVGGWWVGVLFFVCLLFSKQLVQSATPPHSVPAAPNLHETNCVLLRDVGSVVLEIMLWGSRA
jgi:hypothetical protein